VAAVDLLRSACAVTLAICNVPGTLLTRIVDATLPTRAGREIGVAATKTFTAQIAAFATLALHLAGLRGSLSMERIAELRRELDLLPELVQRIVAPDSPTWQVTQHLARAFGNRSHFFFLGRQAGLPVAMEGALKLKEISYIPADAYGAGEMKHGPIALIDDGTPVVAVMTDSHVFEKVVSNVEEVRARGAEVIALTDEARLPDVVEHADWVLVVPAAPAALVPILAVVPLQILAHRIAETKGLPVDQPRNLAKTVTVE
jgi:glucosamine--fructose-6-phosphate aminotransferase (isomerizing)